VADEEEEEGPDFSHLVPEFLHERHRLIVQAARVLGYEPRMVERILGNGVAEDTIETLVDNIVHASVSIYSGGLLTYKDALDEAKRKARTEASSRRESKETSRMSLTSDRVKSLEDIPGSSRRGTLSSTSRSLGGTKETNSSAGRSFGGTGENFKRSTKETNASRNSWGTKESSLGGQRQSSRSIGGTKESVSRSHMGTKESMSPRILQSSLKGGKASLRLSASSKEMRFVDIDCEDGEEDLPRSPASPTLSLPGEVPDAPESTMCTICFEKPIDVELLPCHHKVACEQCMSKAGSLCPFCRTFVTNHKRL